MVVAAAGFLAARWLVIVPDLDSVLHSIAECTLAIFPDWRGVFFVVAGKGISGCENDPNNVDSSSSRSVFY